MSEIVLVRHAESEANVAQSWQGRGNAVLSKDGQSQVEHLRRRLNGRTFDAVVASPLTRTLDTAGAVSDAPRTDERAIEIDLGEWEDQPFATVMANDGERLRAVFAGSDEPFGHTGERLSEVAARIWELIDELAGEVGPDGRGVIVTHGGVIDSVMGSIIPPFSRRAHRIVSNTALTHLVGMPGNWKLARFNDNTHLDPVGTLARQQLVAGHPVIALVRHGRTKANSERRFQGQSCWGLDEVGEAQAQRLAEWFGPLEHVYSSPLDRAVSTATALASDAPIELDGLMEIGLGEWEGLHWDEVTTRWPDLVRRIFQEGEDLRRGVGGETWMDVSSRMVDTMSSLDVRPGQITGVVSHGGAIRAYLGTLAGDLSAPSSRLHNPDNTAVTHIALTEDGPLLCDYALAPHLEQDRPDR